MPNIRIMDSQTNYLCKSDRYDNFCADLTRRAARLLLFSQLLLCICSEKVEKYVT